MQPGETGRTTRLAVETDIKRRLREVSPRPVDRVSGCVGRGGLKGWRQQSGFSHRPPVLGSESAGTVQALLCGLDLQGQVNGSPGGPQQ